MDKKAITVDEFNPETASWDNYIERLKFCFEANGVVVDTVKRANFFTVCGSRVYETLLALITPRKATEVTFSEIEIVLGKHYSPKHNEISISFKFYKRDQRRNEPVSNYIVDLRKLSSGCNFIDLERMLRDRLVCGMGDSRLQYELLKRDNLRYQDAVDAMLASESAGRDVRITEFHNYLMARHFRIITDHKPLLGIFNPKKPMPNMLPPRLIGRNNSHIKKF